MRKYDKKLECCVVCGSNDLSYWDRKNYTYTKNLEHVMFDIYKCNCCGSGFLNPLPSDEFIREIYKYSGHALTEPVSLNSILEKEKEYPNTTIDAKRLVRSLDRLNHTNSKVALDIGSGYGFYTKELNNLGYKVDSINPGKYENIVFKELNGYDVPYVGLFQDFEFSNKFSVVNMSHVLEHIKYPNDIIFKISQLVEEGGGNCDRCA